MAREETDLQDQQVPEKFTAAQSRHRIGQSFQSVVGLHGSHVRSKEVGPGEMNLLKRLKIKKKKYSKLNFS